MSTPKRRPELSLIASERDEALELAGEFMRFDPAATAVFSASNRGALRRRKKRFFAAPNRAVFMAAESLKNAGLTIS
jgi:hypothetical protein